MKRFFATLAASLFAVLVSVSAAQAQSIDLSTLPEAQRKAVLAELAKSSGNAAAPAAPAVAPSAADKELINHAREWAGLGQAVGSGIVAAAKELGMAANDFAKTDLGKITVAVLLWKYLGAQVVGVVFGTFILVAGLSFGWHIVRCAVVMSETVEYVQAPVLWGLFTWKKVAKKEYQRTEDRLRDSQSLQQVVGYVVMAASGIIGSIAIF
jgi:hypothetical protein